MGSGLDDGELLAQFETRTLPFEEWTHRCHVKVGYLYLRQGTFEEALEKMRTGIQAYNAANADLVRTGYHETITVAFLRLIADAMAQTGTAVGVASDLFADANPALLEGDVLDQFYSRDVLSSPAAKASFVTPDRRPLPSSSR